MPRYEPRTRDLMGSPDAWAVTRMAEAEALGVAGRCSWSVPYQDGCMHSCFADLLEEHRSHRRAQDAISSPILRGRDEGLIPTPLRRDDTPERRRHRLSTVRDLSQSGVTDVVKPSAPGWVQEIYGRAARQLGRIADALD